MNPKITSFAHCGVSAKFSRGRGAPFSITESTDGVRLQIYLWQVVEKID